jgi:hypothetical protein
MVELKSIEQVLHFMKSHIHLSRYDEKFIDNISTLVKVTTNQVVLLHKLFFKYQRQFVKHELYVEKLVDLPWHGITVIESSPQYTNGHVTISQDTIYFKCPFNRNFIDEFRKIPLNSFVWSKEKRQYEAPYNIHSLKILVNTASRFFESVHFCEIAQKLIDEVHQYKDVKYWQPTLVKRNKNLYIAASNQYLESALGDLKLTEDESTLVTLTKYGVTISPEFCETDKLKFMYDPIVEVEQSKLQEWIGWLKLMNCDMVYLSNVGSISLSKKKTIEVLEDFSIPYTDLSHAVPSGKYNFPVLIKFKKYTEFNSELKEVYKFISVVNSAPVDVK